MEANRVIFQELAAPWKFILDLAVSGEEAVQMVKEREYQMIILDQMMPGMSGFETADQIQRYSHAPLVLMTADISDEVRSRSIRHGFTDFYAETDPAAADEAGFRNRNSGKIQGTSESGRCVKEGESYRAEERCGYPYAGILLERGGRFTSETSRVCSADLHMFQTKVHGIKASAARSEKRRLPSRQKLWRWRQRPKIVPL